MNNETAACLLLRLGVALVPAAFNSQFVVGMDQFNTSLFPVESGGKWHMYLQYMLM
jgi:hypothetical protein